MASGLLSAACAQASGEAWAEQGREALLPFKQELMAALSRGLQQGPVAAIETCRLEAPEIARRASTDGVRVGRTSHRLRNPANAASPWLVPILEELKGAPADDPGFRTVKLDGGRVGYAETIRIQAPCLTCHGADLAPEVRARLARAYPQDRATGFEVGEFRGLFWVEFEPHEAREP